MTQRDFEIIAGAVREAWLHSATGTSKDSPDTWSRGYAIAMDVVTKTLSDALLKQNPRFNKDIFKEACRR